MWHLIRSRPMGLVTLLVLFALATPVPAAPIDTPADPWPRLIDLGGATATLHQPQVEGWNGNRIRFRAVVGVSAPNRAEDAFGTIWADAVTHVDRVARLVVLDEVTLTRATFPTLADGGSSYLRALQARLARAPQTVALDRLQASLATSRNVTPAGVPVQNVPPRIFVSDGPAVLVPISGPPVLRRMAGSAFERVANTRALILRDARSYYLRLGDGWMTADALDGRWYPADRVPAGLDLVADKLANAGADFLAGGVGPARYAGAPAVFVSHAPAALLLFEGEPVLEPIAGTTLLRAANTPAHVIVDIVSGHYFVLLSGRWFRAPGLNGPWTYVSARNLPPAFAAIPADDPAGAVLASVSGTPQAKAAVIDNAIPQTAVVPRANGPAFAAEFDGHPQYRPIMGTSLSYVANSPTPIVRLDSRRLLALKAGVWFEAASVFGPWAVANAVPDVIYTIPASSPLHHVTYVRIYSATAQFVEVGYTPGYTGSVATPDGVVVDGTGYADAPWVGSARDPAPPTYGIVVKPRDDAARNVYAQWGSAILTGSRVPGAQPLAAAGADHDYVANVDGSVYRTGSSGWEKLGIRGWGRATSEELGWANREQQARAFGAERFERHRTRAGVERLAENRPGAGERSGADAFGAGGGVRVGGLRGRRGTP